MHCKILITARKSVHDTKIPAFNMFKRHIGLGIFWFSTGGSRNILKGAAINEIFGRINSSTCFLWVGSVCVCSSLLTRKEAATFSCILIKLTTNIYHDKKTIPFEFQSQGLDVKVTVYKYGNYLLKTIEIKLLS